MEKRPILAAIASLCAGMIAAAPAMAQTGSTALPAPSALTLLALGIAGLVIGRRAAAGKHRDED